MSLVQAHRAAGGTERPARLAPTGRTAGAYAASFALFLAAYAFAMTSGFSPFIYFRF